MSKILSICWYKVLPAKFGGQKGIALFTKYLSKSHQVVLLASRNNEMQSDLSFQLRPALPVSKSQFLNPFCWKKILKVAQEVKPSFIILEHPYHGIAAQRARKKTGAKLIVHSHNIESERFRSLGKWWWRTLAGYEKWVYRKADLSLFKTARDLEWAVSKFGLEKNKCMIVPYGIEEGAIDKTTARHRICARHNILPGEKILLFAGTLDYEPNAKAVEMIFKKIAPGLAGKNIRLIICGRNELSKYQSLKKLTHPSVIYAGEVEDIGAYFAAADILLDPVETGAGIQTKIIEALGHNCNVACFENLVDEQLKSIAAEKIFTAPVGDYDILRERVYLALEKNPPTPAAFFEFYRWEKIMARLNDKLQSI